MSLSVDISVVQLSVLSGDRCRFSVFQTLLASDNRTGTSMLVLAQVGRALSAPFSDKAQEGGDILTRVDFENPIFRGPHSS
jgi:hypothetical protein